MRIWQTKSLADVATCLDSQRIPVKEDERQKRVGSVPYYGANGQVGWIDEAIFNEPLLLIAEDGGHFDEPERGVAYTITGPSWINNHAHALRLDESKVRLDFLGYHFRHFDFQPYITGTTRAKLTQRDLMRVEVPVPPLAEQERIVKLLDEADRLRTLRTQADQRIAALIPALFHEMFDDPIINPKGWPLIRLGEIAPLKCGYAFKSTDYCSEGVRLVRISNLDGQNLTFEKRMVYLPDSFLNDYPAFQLESSDVLIAMSGATTGKLGQVRRTDVPSLLNQRVGKFLIRDKNRLEPTFLFSMLNIPVITQKLIGEAAGSAQANVSPSGVGSVEIPLPPIALQKEFADRVAEIRELEAGQATSRTRLDTLFQSMLHRAFNGEL
jgi:type I restriction enzyme, S subunit